MDKESVINSWNAAAAKLFHNETGYIIGKHFDTIFTEEDKKNDIPGYNLCYDSIFWRGVPFQF